jgi:hypothetical protein
MSTILAANPTGYLPVPNIGVPQIKNAALVQAAATISEESNILSSTGGASAIPQSTDPVSLLNWFMQPYSATSAAVPAAGAGGAEFAGIQQSVDQQLLGGMATDSTLNATYNASGAVKTPSSLSSASWAAIVKASPNGAAAMTANATELSILSQLPTYA